MDRKNMVADFENQSFENLDVNPYEVVIAVSKKAREINSKALKYLGPEVEIKPISIALNKLKNEEVSFEYSESRETSFDAAEPEKKPALTKLASKRPLPVPDEEDEAD